MEKKKRNGESEKEKGGRSRGGEILVGFLLFFEYSGGTTEKAY